MALPVLSSRKISCGRKQVVLVLENALIISIRLMVHGRKRNIWQVCSSVPQSVSSVALPALLLHSMVVAVNNIHISVWAAQKHAANSFLMLPTELWWMNKKQERRLYPLPSLEAPFSWIVTGVLGHQELTIRMTNYCLFLGDKVAETIKSQSLACLCM